MTDEQLDAKVAPTLEFCSPYRAVRFLAFKERPIEERYAMLAYKAQNNYNSLCPWANSDSELTWESSELQSKYYEACNLLKLQLMLGAIQSRGCPVPDTARIKNFWEKWDKPNAPSISDYYTDYEFTKEELVDISFFNRGPEFNMEVCDAWMECTGFWNDHEACAYFDVEIVVESLYRYLESDTSNSDNLKSNKRGRPPGTGYNDDIALGFMHALVTEERLTPHKAAYKAIEAFKRKGASVGADVKRLTGKYSTRFKVGE